MRRRRPESIAEGTDLPSAISRAFAVAKLLVVQALLAAPRGPFPRHRADFVEHGEGFFDRHGGKTVFFGRWVPVLRFTAAWLAGVHQMEWWRFALWNALGGVAWATSVGLAAYALGSAAIQVLPYVGATAVVTVVIVVVAFYVWRRRRKG